MKGRDRFTKTEAEAIKALLRRVRLAEPGTPQKLLRDQLRGLGFYISDWGGGPGGFTASDFDDLVRRGAVTISDDPGPVRPAARPPRRPQKASRLARSPEPADDAPSALTALAGPPISIEMAMHGGVPDRPGLYAIYGSPGVWSTLGLGKPPDDRPLYIGKAEGSLVSRDLNTHFASGTTGRSSPRRSLAALLAAAGELDLVAMPRRPNDPEPGKWTHYALESPGEQQLTDWMRRELRIAVWPARADTRLRTLETTVMRHWIPPLNLTGVTTPWSVQVKSARARMAEQAKAWARSRGFDI